MTIAYLINQYPKVSHSFIRREIGGLEAMGIPVARFSIRTCAPELVDEADKQELEKTQSILGIGIAGLVFSLLRVAITKPLPFLKAFGLTIKVGWKSERGILRNASLFSGSLRSPWLVFRLSNFPHSWPGTNSTTVAMLCTVLAGIPELVESGVCCWLLLVRGSLEPLTAAMRS